MIAVTCGAALLESACPCHLPAGAFTSTHEASDCSFGSSHGPGASSQTPEVPGSHARHAASPQIKLSALNTKAPPCAVLLRFSNAHLSQWHDYRVAVRDRAARVIAERRSSRAGIHRLSATFEIRHAARITKQLQAITQHVECQHGGCKGCVKRPSARGRPGSRN